MTWDVGGKLVINGGSFCVFLFVLCMFCDGGRWKSVYYFLVDFFLIDFQKGGSQFDLYVYKYFECFKYFNSKFIQTFETSEITLSNQ